MKKTTLGLILGNINPGFEFDITQGVINMPKNMALI